MTAFRTFALIFTRRRSFATLTLAAAFFAAGGTGQAQWQPGGTTGGTTVPNPAVADQFPGTTIPTSVLFPEDTPAFILERFRADVIYSLVEAVPPNNPAHPFNAFSEDLNLITPQATTSPWYVSVPTFARVNSSGGGFGDTVTIGQLPVFMDIQGTLMTDSANFGGGSAIASGGVPADLFVNVGSAGIINSDLGSGILIIDDDSNLTVINQGQIIGRAAGINATGNTAGAGSATVALYNTSTGSITSTGSLANGGVAAVVSGSDFTGENHGLIQGPAGIVSGGGTNSLLNTGSILASDGDAVSFTNALGSSTITNAAGGMITSGDQGGGTGAGVRIAGGGSVVNHGTIAASGAVPILTAAPTFNPGVGLGTGGSALNGSVYNTGTISAVSGNPAVWVNGTGQNTVTNNGGTITGGSGGPNGAAVLGGAGSDTVVNMNSALLRGGSGSANAIALGAGNDTVTTDNWSQIQGNIDGGAGTDTLQVNLSGISPRTAATLRSAAGSSTGAVSVRGTTYSWTNVENVQFNTISFTDWGRTRNQRAVGGALDSLSVRPTEEVQNIYDNITAAGSGAFPAIANSLSPQRYEAANLIAVTQSTFRYRNLQRRFDNIFNGQNRLEQVDTTGIVMRDAGMSPRVADTNQRLASLSLSHRTMSDVPGAVFGGFDKNFYEPKDMVPALFPPEIPDLEMEPEHHWGLWISGTGIFGDGDGNADISGFDYDAAGAMIGADYRMLPELSLGLFGGYDYTNADLDAIGSTMEVNSATVGTYAAWSWEGWHADATFAYSFDFYENERQISIPGTSATASSSPEGNHFTVGGGFGYDFTFGKSWDEEFRIGPLASIQYTNVTVDGFSEGGAGPLGLNVSEQNPESLRSQLGGRFSYVARLRKATLIPHLYATWVHEFYEDPYTINASFQQPGVQSFGVVTSGTGRDFALVGGGIDALFFDYLTAFLGYDAQLGQEDFFAQEVTGGVRFDF